MSSYLTSLYTTTTSRYASLRRNLLSSEEDGDTEDDSHISRVLRAYYTEKGRPFPPWLPPDPKAPQAQQAPAAIASRQGSVGRGSGSGSGLSDLWDSPGQGQAQEPMSLRRGAPARAGARQPQGRPGMLDPPEQQTSRPLPSQKAGSLQSQFSAQQRQSANPSPSSVKRVWDNGAGEAQSEIVGQCEVGESDWEFKYTRDGERREQSRVESGWIEKSP